MKVHLLNVSNGPKYRDLGGALKKDFAAVCRKHVNVSATVQIGNGDIQAHASSWQKIPAMIAELGRVAVSPGDWVFWIDSDVVILDLCRDPADYIDPRLDLAISIDAHGICAGVFAVKKCPWSIWMLQSLLMLGAIDSDHQAEFDRTGRGEQDSLKTLLRYFPAVRDHISIFGEEIVQNRKSRFNKEAWLFHFWMAGRTTAEILRKREHIRRHGWTKAVFRFVSRFCGQTWGDVKCVASRLRVTPRRLAELIGMLDQDAHVRPSTELSPRTADALIRYANILDLAVRAKGSDSEALRWLKAKHLELNSETPLAYAANASRSRRIEGMLLALVADRKQRDSSFIFG